MILLLHLISLLFLYHSIRSTLSLGTTCSRLAETILELSIQILNNHEVFFKNLKRKVNLCKAASVQYNYL